MAYWFLDKKSKKTFKGRIFGSIQAVAQNTDLNEHTLYSHFSREKNVVFENEDVRLERRSIEKSEVKAMKRQSKPKKDISKVLKSLKKK